MNDTSEHPLLQEDEGCAGPLSSCVNLETQSDMNARFEAYISHVADGKVGLSAGNGTVPRGSDPTAYAHLLGPNEQAVKVLEMMQHKDKFLAPSSSPNPIDKRNPKLS